MTWMTPKVEEMCWKTWWVIVGKDLCIISLGEQLAKSFSFNVWLIMFVLVPCSLTQLLFGFFCYSYWCFFVPASQPVDHKLKNTIWENMCWNQEKHSPYQISAGKLLRSQMLDQIIKHHVFIWQYLNTVSFFNSDSSGSGEFICSANKL